MSNLLRHRSQMRKADRTRNCLRDRSPQMFAVPPEVRSALTPLPRGPWDSTYGITIAISLELMLSSPVVTAVAT
jgi:hypothetical protein